MQRSTRKSTHISEEIANSEALARLVELGLIDVNVVADNEAAAPQIMYSLSDKFTTASNSP